MENLNILVEAKKEYTGQLCDIMTPVMINVFEDLYKEAEKMSNGKKILIMFQKLLKEVPNWSNAMSKSHSDNITERCAWFNDLLAAVFVSHVKILSSVRLKSENKKISLKLPTNEVFIQTAYNNVAKELYKDPYIFNEEQSEYVRDEKLACRITQSIESTIKELIPVQQILQTYMSQDTNNIDLGGEMQDTEDPDVIDDQLEEPFTEGGEMGDFGSEETHEEPPIQHQHQDQETGEDFTEPQQGIHEVPEMVPSLDNEFKTIPMVRDTHYPRVDVPVPQDNVLFGDAPEHRTKKVGYN
jgi:hypothetical protein